MALLGQMIQCVIVKYHSYTATLTARYDIRYGILTVVINDGDTCGIIRSQLHVKISTGHIQDNGETLYIFHSIIVQYGYGDVDLILKPLELHWFNSNIVVQIS